MKRQIFIAATIIAATLIYFYFDSANHKEVLLEDLEPVSVASLTLPQSLAPDAANNRKKQQASAPQAYLECRELKRTYSEDLIRWGRKLEPDKWLKEGYSLDEVTFALEKYQNANFASQWRIGQIVSASFDSDKDERVAKMREANEILRQLGNPVELRVSITYPREEFKDLDKMGRAARLLIYRNYPPTLEDLAALIRDHQLRDEIATEIIAEINDLNRPLQNTDNKNAIYIFDLFAIMNREYLLETLIDKGVSPKNDIYLPNALETSLQNLFFKNTAGQDIEPAIKMIKKLMSLGLSVRYQINQDGALASDSQTLLFAFDPQMLSMLEENYDLDLLSLYKSETSLLPNSLIERLEIEKFAFQSKKYPDFDVEKISADCDTIIEAVDSRWKNPHSTDIFVRLQELENNYHGDPEAIRSLLASKDPEQVDCYIEQQHMQESYEQNSLSINNLFFQYQPHNRRKTRLVDFLRQRPLDDSEKRWALSYVLRNQNAQLLEGLFELQLMPSKIDFYDFNWQTLEITFWEQLINGGLELSDLDSHGKNAMYFAVAHQKLALLEYFIKKGYTFSPMSDTQDPLHRLLAPWKLGYSKKFAIDALRAFVPLSPAIDEHHRKRMRLIRLMDKEFYDQLVGILPSLSVSSEAPLPQALCL